MFKLTEIYSNISHLISKYSSLILSFGYVLLGILIFFFPTELSKKAGIAMCLVLKKVYTFWLKILLQVYTFLIILNTVYIC